MAREGDRGVRGVENQSRNHCKRVERYSLWLFEHEWVYVLLCSRGAATEYSKSASKARENKKKRRKRRQ
jgi:hypothetical protein